MPHEKLLPSFTFTEDRINKLFKIAPEAFADGKINWDVLQEALGTQIEDEGAEAEQFGLFWPGKREARRKASIPSYGTLIPVKGEGVNEDTTRNIFIEGENLDTLKLLQKSYTSQIKAIYIDPPYNNGDDFIYDDNFTEPLDVYLKYTGQLDGEGNPLTTNTKADGRFHSKWLTMIYPRLRLARSLLKLEGVIFVSIDDNEVHNLKQVLNEIFGEENFEGHIHWRRRHNQPNDKTKMIGTVAEHILVYAKDSKALKEVGVGKVDITGSFSNPDDDARGPWASKPWKVGSDQSGSRYKIKSPTGKIFDEYWMGEEDTYKDFLKDNRIVFPKSGDGLPRKKYFQSEREAEGQCATNWWSHEEFGHNQGANDEMTDLFGVKNIFSNPKPTKLITSLFQLANVKANDIVLDFFAGSGTSGHAAMKYSIENSFPIKFICIQLQEEIDSSKEAYKVGYRRISEISKDRIKYSIKALKKETKKKDIIDLGFKVFRLASSHFKAWKPYIGKNIEEVENLFSESPLLSNWSEQGLLTEIILQEGFPLDSNITADNSYKKNRVYQVISEFCEHKLLVCLDKKVSTETISNIKRDDKDIFICLDSAITDAQKITLSDKGFLKTV